MFSPLKWMAIVCILGGMALIVCALFPPIQSWPDAERYMYRKDKEPNYHFEGFEWIGLMLERDPRYRFDYVVLQFEIFVVVLTTVFFALAFWLLHLSQKRRFVGSPPGHQLPTPAQTVSMGGYLWERCQDGSWRKVAGDGLQLLGGGVAKSDHH